MPSPADEVAALSRLSRRALYAAFADVARASAEGESTTAAEERVAELLAQTMTLADLMGRRRLLLEAEQAGGFADEPSPLVPRTRFKEAIADIVRRFPILERSAERVSALYRKSHAFALARSATLEITQRVQKFMSDAIAIGKPTPDAVDVLAATEDFSTAYADTVYRTNLATAYTAGRMEQARDPQIRKSLPAYEVIGPTAADPDTRQGRKEDRGENHAAAVGLIASTDDPVWKTHSPPFGYSCRHGLRLVSRPELRRRGLLRADGSVVRYEPPGLANFAPHPRFTSSPLQRIYGQG